MKITQEGDYALRVVLYLYKLGVGERIEAKVIADDENIPLRFLLKLLRKLVSVGIVASYRGTGGGYAVEKAPSKVSIKDVIEAIEGPIYLNKCLYDPNDCNLNRADICEIHKALDNVQSRLISNLSDLTFDRILSENKLLF